MPETTFKCHFCDQCNGTGCIGEMPGMGGFSDNINFQMNCDAWKDIAAEMTDSANKGGHSGSLRGRIRLAPVTGAVENIGYHDEAQYYHDMISACHAAGVHLSIGDGCPDIKLQSGIQAVRDLKGAKAAVFIKPYPDDIFLERMDWASDIAEAVGIDIDSCNIVTMRNLVQLERKSAAQLKTLKKAAGVPFIMKGVFTRRDIELASEVHPDIIVVSNHGGRVENRIGSTARFLQENAAELKNCCDQIWIDGGIRYRKDIENALLMGAAQVMIGRPFISALCKSGSAGVAECAAKLCN